MVNDFKPVNPINELCKFVDDITIEAPGYDEDDTGAEEVENMKLWSDENRMVLNMNKTYEMIVRDRTSIPLYPVAFRPSNGKHGSRYLELPLRKYRKIGTYTTKRCLKKRVVECTFYGCVNIMVLQQSS
ncbi:Hypothetical predicted protein [Paramuricea clavata]|uniref:Uncharacterized protein n=1 Tax=Paramuricea clavata TaxID=317549 RepID=A0A7D9L4B8_PARCT|nr:Hypothetical predicted protein [Paramuricea clavata]